MLQISLVRPVGELLVHDPPFTTQERPKTLIHIVDSACRQVTKSNTKLGPLTPSSRIISATEVPDSACVNANALCLSVKRFFPIRKNHPSGDTKVQKPDIPDRSRNGENVRSGRRLSPTPSRIEVLVIQGCDTSFAAVQE